MKMSKKLAASLMAAGAVLVGGGIAAAVDLPELPDTSVAEDKAGDVEAPPADPQATADEHRQNEDAGNPNGSEQSEGEGEGERPTDTHGALISDLATTTESEGQAKGEEISTAASANGTATSADHAQNDDAQGPPEEPGSQKPDTTPTADSNPGTEHRP